MARKTPEPVTPRLYPIPQAAAALGIGRTTFYELLAAGDIASVRIGGRRLIPVDEVDAYVTKLRSEAL